jgi:hypothetical protein
MQLIEHGEVGSGGAASITFSAIPDDYTDLYIVASARTNQTANVWGDFELRPNGSTSGLSQRLLVGTGSTAFSGAEGTRIYGGGATSNTATANTFGSSTIYIPNYLSNVAKSVSGDMVTENNGTAALAQLGAGLWNNTAAITSIVLQAGTGSSTFLQHSSFSLYGILAGSDGIVSVS